MNKNKKINQISNGIGNIKIFDDVEEKLFCSKKNDELLMGILIHITVTNKYFQSLKSENV